jgi:DNA-binding IclR family transcriptional regulator
MDTSRGAQAVERAAQILTCFRFDRQERSLSEIADLLNLNASTARRILAKLQEYELIEQDEVTRQYRLGIKLFELGNIVASGMTLQRCATPVLQDLVEKFNETMHLSVLRGNHVFCLQKLESNRAVRTHSRVGTHGPLHCTGSGKVLAAYLFDDDQLRLMEQEEGFTPFTDTTISDLRVLRDHLAQVRSQGYAVDDREHEAEVRCIAVPVRDASAKVIAAISMTGPAGRFRQERDQEIAESLKLAAERLSAMLGYDESHPRVLDLQTL